MGLPIRPIDAMIRAERQRRLDWTRFRFTANGESVVTRTKHCFQIESRPYQPIAFLSVAERFCRHISMKQKYYVDFCHKIWSFEDKMSNFAPRNDKKIVYR